MHRPFKGRHLVLKEQEFSFAITNLYISLFFLSDEFVASFKSLVKSGQSAVNLCPQSEAFSVMTLHSNNFRAAVLEHKPTVEHWRKDNYHQTIFEAMLDILSENNQ